jgi:hypothetical protein
MSRLMEITCIVAFLPYDTVALEVQKGCPPELRHRIVEEMAS